MLSYALYFLTIAGTKHSLLHLQSKHALKKAEVLLVFPFILGKKMRKSLLLKDLTQRRKHRKKPKP